jgi:hypothetical protein
MSTQMAIITYDLTDPDAQAAFELAMDAPKLRSVLWNFDQWLRNEIKHKDRSEWPDATRIRTELYSAMRLEGVAIYE